MKLSRTKEHEPRFMKHSAAQVVPKKINWDKKGPGLYLTLSKALADHDETYAKFPFLCIESCWSHDARDLMVVQDARDKNPPVEKE